MKSDAQENQLSGYLLGELPEPEQTALERQLLADRETFDAAWAVEHRLIDGYVRGELPPADRERFERHYLTSDLHRERVAIAELFLDEIEGAPEPMPAQVAPSEIAPADSWRRRVLDSLRGPQLVFSGAMAMALLLAIGGALWLLRERSRLRDELAQAQRQVQTEAHAVRQREQALATQKQALETEIAEERARGRELNAELDRLRQAQPATPAAILSFLLTPLTRDKTGPPPPVIPRIKRGVQLLVEVGGSEYTRYQMKLQTVEGRAVLSQPAGKTPDRAFAAATLPAGALARGDYVLILFGQSSAGEWEEVDRYFFRVQ
jgi:anti-sigma factor RsiW